MIESSWKRIAGIHVENDGRMGAVWLADDPLTSVVHLYDAAYFAETVPAVITEGMAARGRSIPVAWRRKDRPMAEMLLEAGLSPLPDACEEAEARVHLDSETINQMLQASQLRVDKRVSSWLNEYRKFFRQETKVPDEGFPLMAATRWAIQMLRWARSDELLRGHQRRAPKIRVV